MGLEVLYLPPSSGVLDLCRLFSCDAGCHAPLRLEDGSGCCQHQWSSPGLYGNWRIFGMATVLAEFFYPKEGEDAWLVVLLVLPAYSCIAYSIGMARRGWAGGCLRNDLP